jgi:radical SAM superfamily enzyme YgiQ (UPF0313 family)
MDFPMQYLGDEPNSYRKPWDEAAVRMCVFASWPYEQAAGNQALPLVYKTVNEASNFLCDRTYLPSTPRDLKLLEGKAIPVFGIESKHQLADFDVIGTSISYPVLAINFIKQLAMSGIPTMWEDGELATGPYAGRGREPERYPMILAGGQAYGAPEVLANVADAVFCGEVEDEVDNPGLVEVLEAVGDFKASGLWSSDREECYRQLAREFSFLYFARFTDVRYGYEQRPTVERVLGREAKPSKQVVAIETLIDGMPLPSVKRFVKDLNAVAPLDNPPLLYNDPGMGAGDLETQRGCPAWCNFCALTYRQKPYRQRDVPYMVEFGKNLVRNTGSIHLAPFGPDFPMHTQKKLLIKELNEKVIDDIDASSMRVDDFIADPSYILLQAAAGMDTVTLGVEGNSQRMRDLVGKGAADEDIKEAVARAIAAGLKKIKLYMIAFLPGEDEGDIYRLLVLARELANIRDSMGSKALIQFSWTPMLIEGNTPFQWFQPTTVNFALSDVWEELRKLRMAYKLGGKARKDKVNFAQLTQRASREIGKAMVEAVTTIDRGCWGGAPLDLYETVEERLVAHGFLNGYADAYDERQKHDMFGWELIDQGINVELMWVSYQQMREFLENTDSDTYDRLFGDEYRGNEWIERCDTRCYGRGCGVCDAKDLQIRKEYIRAAQTEDQTSLSDVKPVDRRSVAMKVRARVVRDDGHRTVMNDHFRYAIRRAANRAELPITPRTVRFASDAIRFKDWTSGVDYVEFGLLRRVSDLDKLIEAMNVELGAAIQIEHHIALPANVPLLREDVDLSLYSIEVDEPMDKLSVALDRWRDDPDVTVVIHEKKPVGIVRREVSGHDYVDDIWIAREGHRVYLRSLVRGAVNPYAVVAALLKKPSWLDVARYPARRLDAFIDTDPSTIDFFRPSCEDCGRLIPVNILDLPYDPEVCPKCKDGRAGMFVREFQEV